MCDYAYIYVCMCMGDKSKEGGRRDKETVRVS